MTAVGYICRMATIGEAARDQVKAVLLEASKDPAVSPPDFEALVYAARKVFFLTPYDVGRR